MMKAFGVSERQNLEKFVTLQAYYSLAGRDLEHEIVPFLQDQMLGLTTWSPLAGGFLSGKYRRGGAKETDARRMKFDFPPIDVEKAFDIVEVLERVASRYGNASVAQVALSWLLHQNHVTSVIIGAKAEAQLLDNLASAALKLSSDDLVELDTVSRPTPIYPSWMFQMVQSERYPGKTREMSGVTQSTIQTRE
jgi:aryl-alcohol dehydrogenase-like predicted oxidoreductase